ncbi:MAG: hypothetical protein ACR2NP_08075 [Pirellulaceae bacterium]
MSGLSAAFNRLTQTNPCDRFIFNDPVYTFGVGDPMTCNHLFAPAAALLAILLSFVPQHAFGQTWGAQGAAVMIGDSSPDQSQTYYRANWGTANPSYTYGMQPTAPVEAAPGTWYQLEEVAPGTSPGQNPTTNWTPDRAGQPWVVEGPVPGPCGSCCGPTHAEKWYSMQCPGHQGLSKLEQLHAQISLSDTPLCSGLCGHGQQCPPPPKVMSADYSAVVFTKFLDKELVRSWLPDGLILDPDCPFQDCHPIIILAGEQRNFARTTDKTVYPLWGRNYNELFMSIPWVKMAKSPNKPPMHHFFCVYLDNWPGTYLGIERGWPKLLVPVASRGNCYSVLDCCNNQIFQSVTDYAHAEPVCVGANESLNWIRTMLEMPMVLRKPRDCGFKVMDFDLHFECAKIHSVCSELRINCGFLPGLPASCESVPGINQTTYGAFHLDTRFTARKMKY